MKQRPVFLSARWEYLAMFNYHVPSSLLLPHLPKSTELDTWNGQAVVSIVGFLFNNIKVLGIRWPWYTNFEEVNLRFYIKHFDGFRWKRGVAFISEVVPKRLVALVANHLYNEHYSYMPMRHSISNKGNVIKATFEWKCGKDWNQLSVMADQEEELIAPNSEEEFIFERYWGYNQLNEDVTIEYGIEHPRWFVNRVIDYQLSCNVASMYGEAFVPYLTAPPASVFLAKGSDVIVRKPRLLKGK